MILSSKAAPDTSHVNSAKLPLQITRATLLRKGRPERFYRDMRLDPISQHDYCTITQTLAKIGEWQGIRLGCQLRLVRFTTAKGERIEYAVRIKKQAWISAQKRTVKEALDECNSLILGRARASTVQPVFIPQTQPLRPEWLPYKESEA